MKLLLTPRGPFGELAIAPSGRTISFIGSREDGPAPHDLWLLPVNMPAAKNLTSASLDRTVFSYRWNRDASLILLAADGFTRKLIRYSSSNEREDIATPETMPSSFAVADNGTIAFVGENSTEPQEIWIGAAGQQLRKSSSLNKSLDAFSTVKPEIYKYKSFDGLEIEAAVLKPSGYDGKSKLPLIALIHGGPTGRWSASIDTWGQLLVAKGFAIFYPNIRGSIGYGQKFTELNRGDWGGADFRDVVAGVEDLIHRGIADASHIGIGGWSYGGYMAE